MKFQVTWQERYTCSAEVEAESEDEAASLVASDPTIYHPDHGDFVCVDKDSIDVTPLPVGQSA